MINKCIMIILEKLQGMVGPGNRFKNVASALKLAQECHTQVLIEYDTLGLWSIEQPHETMQPWQRYYRTWSLDFFEESEKNISKLKIDKKIMIWEQHHSSWMPSNDINLQYNNILDNIQKHYLEYWNRINFCSEIIDSVSNQERLFNISNIVGVTLRTWLEAPSRQNLYDLNDIIQTMERYTDDFFVCSDSKKAFDDVKDVFGSRVINQFLDKPSHFEQYDRDHCKNLYIDALLLGKCKTIIASYMSTFPEWAWWMGNCQANVIVPLLKIIQPYYDGQIYF